MSEYVRPTIPERVFRDRSGQVIEYGDRWKGGMPAEDSYSVETDLERFAPLHTIAEALIDHLSTRYLVEASDDVALAGELLKRRTDVIRAVRLVPDDPDAAPLTFVFTSYPSVWLHAGLLAEFPFPFCSCDACDESWWTQADQLEWTALTVAAGGFSEQVRLGPKGQVGYSLIGVDGSRGGATTLDDNPADEIQAAKARLDALPAGWKAWGNRH